LGLVQYLKKFIPGLATHTAHLTPLTKKEVKSFTSMWGSNEDCHFEAIKRIITSLPCLRVIDHESPDPVWLMTDASNVGVGAALLQGPTWQTARPIGFDVRVGG
jgi:hypothetical protein